MSVRFALSLALATCLLASSGCQRTHAPLAGVTGMVTIRGLPMREGLIVFTPDMESGCYGSIASGEIDRDGRFVLFTESQRGAAVGWHRVTIASLDTQSFRLPNRYQDPKSSGLRVKVEMGKENVLDFRLDNN